MCFGNHKGERFRNFDIFGAPIGVTFNSDTEYKTKLGGFITILMLLLFGTNMILEMINVVFHEDYSSKISDSYTQYSL